MAEHQQVERSCLRLATEAEIASVAGLAATCVGAPEWTAAEYAKYVDRLEGEHLRRCLLLAEGKSGIDGFIAGTFVGEVADLDSIAVREERRGHGVGSMLCAAFVQWAKIHGAKLVELEVRAANQSALRVYRSHGFVETGRRRGYYRDPVDDAVLMSLRFEDEGNG